MKPVIDPSLVSPKSRRPIAGYVREEARWCFSMRYWRQIENFGLGDVSQGWFVSLFGRMQSLCEISVETFLKDTVLQSQVRFHTLDWDGKNVPLKRADFDWLPEVYLENSEEYPFYQFHVSKALGRVVGFFDENNIFNVLLLDPHHNIQPSKYNEYQIRPTKHAICMFASMKEATISYLAESISESSYIIDGFEKFIDKNVHVQTNGYVICRLAEDHYNRLFDLQGKIELFSLKDVIELGLMQYESDLK